jgi:type VI secretion system protein ImpH
MDSPSRRENAPLNERLRDNPGDFDFFQAVRMMVRMAERGALPGEERSPGVTPPKRKPVGHDYAPHEEVVRFRSVASHAFAATEIVKMAIAREAAATEGDANAAGAKRAANAPPLEMFVSFLGLTGPNGVLPQHYTTQLIDRIKAKDFSLADFLDLFNHRMISLFYRAWEKYRFPIGFERFRLAPERDEPDDLFTSCMYSLVGFGTNGLRRRQEFDDETLVYYGGHFARRNRRRVLRL